MINSAVHTAGTKIKLYREWPNRQLIDTAALNDAGQASFSITDTIPVVLTIELRKPHVSKTFVVEGGLCKVTISGDSQVTVTGGVLQNRLEDFLLKIKPLEKHWSASGHRYEKATNLEEKLVAERESKELGERVQAERIAFINHNRDNILGQWYTHHNLNLWRLKDLQMLNAYFSLSEQNNKISKEIEAKIQSLQSNLLVGTKAPAFILPSNHGDSISLEGLLKKNKYILVDFWASWCTPCRAINRNIAPHYAALKSKGIEIVSISVDDNHEAWKKAISSDQIPWIQLISKSMKSKVVLDFKVQSLPSTFLIDQQSRVVKQNVEVEELQKLL